MKYSFTRKISPKRFFPEMNFESVEFSVIEADTKEEAQKETEDWINDWLMETRSKVKTVSTEQIVKKVVPPKINKDDLPF